MCPSVDGVHAVLGVEGTWPPQHHRNPMAVLRGADSATCVRNDRATGRELPNSESGSACCMSYRRRAAVSTGRSQQEGTAPAPTCCPATHSWSSAELRGFSCVCGPGIQKVHFSVNDIKPQVNVWKPGNGFLLKQPNVFLSPLRLRISLLLSEKWSHSIWRLAPSDTAHLAFRLSGGLQWNHTWHSQSSWEKAGVLRVFSLSVKITEARTNPPFFTIRRPSSHSRYFC